jgi:hypothetical protein
LYPIDNNLYLESLQSNWLAAQLPVRSYCGYELQSTYGVIIVDRQSATNLCTEHLDPIDANHINIVKPSDERAIPYLAFKAAFRAHSAAHASVSRGVTGGGQPAAIPPPNPAAIQPHPDTPISTVEQLGTATITITKAASSIVYDIQRPPVNTPKTSVPWVTFKADDKVTVVAGGCVQTGGSGKTWKRFVDPVGPDSAQKYHGLMQLPGMSGLVRIASLVGRPVRIAQDGALTLGYEDSNYGDNGYWGRDPGDADQCLTEPDAYIKITVTRNIINTPTP